MSRSGVPVISDIAGAVGAATSGQANPIKPLVKSIQEAGTRGLEAGMQELNAEQARAEEAKTNEDNARKNAMRGRISTLLSGGGAGIENPTTSLSRRTLLGK